jgi:diacylglycerol kinase (ATP)
VATAASDLKRVLRSFGFAGAGVMALVQTQPNARVHIVVGVLAAWLAYVLALSPLECMVLVLTMSLVLVTEAINSAIEAAVDLASPAIHPLARQAKDMAAGAVLLSALTAVVVGLVLFAPRLFLLLSN